VNDSIPFAKIVTILEKDYPVSMCAGRADFDVTTGQLQNQGYFQGVYCNAHTIVYNIATSQTIDLLQHIQ